MRIIAAVGAAVLFATSATASSLLHPIFGDHAILQRDAPIALYGDTKAGSDVSVTLAATTRHVRAGADGHWQISMPAMPAGGPYTLTVRAADDEEQVAKDILVGDVFLCGGQSNMAFEVRGAENAQADIATSKDDGLRSLTIKTKDSVSALSSFANPVSWIAAAPDTTGAFSASCYFFARELRKSSHVPVGMVVAAWGGSRLRAWLSEGGLKAADLEPQDRPLLALRRTDPDAADRGWDAEWEAWWRARHGAGTPPWSPQFDASAWKTAPATLGPWAFWTGKSPDGFVGQMWLRSEVTLTAAQAAQPATLDLGMVTEEDESWVNGHGVGGTSGLPQARHTIPAGVLHAGTNVIVTNIFCSWRNCGLVGPAEARAVRLGNDTSVPLNQPWCYAQMADDEIAPQLPWGPAHGVSVIYNGMIAPIGPYGFKAALWYQGESDVHFAPAYERTLKAMLADWRGQFGTKLPFVVVQLPNFGPRPDRPSESAFADIREAQRRVAISDPRSDYVVTIDIGNPANIHPTNKQEVGRRLAAAVQRLLYRTDAPTGPRPDRAIYRNGNVTVSFAGVSGKLVSFSGNPTAFEMCGAAGGSCRYVEARLAGPSTITLLTGGPRPTRLRYCWGDSPVCNLSDASQLPASPFEISVR